MFREGGGEAWSNTRTLLLSSKTAGQARHVTTEHPSVRKLPSTYAKTSERSEATKYLSIEREREREREGQDILPRKKKERHTHTKEHNRSSWCPRHTSSLQLCLATAGERPNATAVPPPPPDKKKARTAKAAKAAPEGVSEASRPRWGRTPPAGPGGSHRCRRRCRSLGENPRYRCRPSWRKKTFKHIHPPTHTHTQTYTPKRGGRYVGIRGIDEGPAGIDRTT